MKTLSIFFLLLFSVHYSNAQGFHFGANISGISSQIEGDQLRGFNKLGYSFGLIGGYTFTENHYLIVSPQYSFFGSKKKQERIPRETNKVFTEAELKTINLLLGYSYRFGDTWSGKKQYRFNTGLRLHRLFNANTQIIRTSNVVGEINIDEDEDLKNFFVTLEFGAGLNFSSNFGMELTYNHSFNNILKNQKANISKLAPFYFSLGVSYYFF